MKIFNELFVTAEDIGLTIVEPLEFIILYYYATNCWNIHNSKGLGDTRYIMCNILIEKRYFQKLLDSFMKNKCETNLLFNLM